LGIFFVTTQTWIGLAHPQGSSVRLLPLLIVAHALSLSATGVARDTAAYSLLFTIVACLVIGESLAWLSARFGHALRELRWLAGHDPLTGAANRREFTAVLEIAALTALTH
jgi:hypothetical protein